MEIVCHLLYEMQQEYFGWANKTSNPGAGPVAVPTFERIVSAMTSYRAESLSPMPHLWYTLASCPRSAPRPGPTAPAAAPAAARTAGSTPTVNPHADARIKQRFKDSGFNSIKDMINGRPIPYPMVNQKPLCAAWILKGHCTTSCKLAAQHVRPTAAANKATHEFLNACGVANPPN
jgi:hypothetical protein